MGEWMKVHKFTVYAMDLNGECGRDEEGVIDSMKWELRNQRYFHSKVVHEGSADIGEWDDDHPLNLTSSTKEDFENYFEKDIDS